MKGCIQAVTTAENGRATSPAASSTNVRNVGPVKDGRKSSGSSISDPGNLSARSIGGALCEGVSGNCRCFHIPDKITRQT